LNLPNAFTEQIIYAMLIKMLYDL